MTAIEEEEDFKSSVDDQDEDRLKTIRMKVRKRSTRDERRCQLSIYFRRRSLHDEILPCRQVHILQAQGFMQMPHRDGSTGTTR